MNKYYTISLILFVLILALILVGGFIYAFFINPDYFIHHKEYETKGSAGERGIYLALRKFGVPKDQIFPNVLIEKEDGTLAEIDIVVLSKKAIFVFEVKNYSGKIFGDTKYPKWIQYTNNKKSYFLSPISQNKKHVIALEEYLSKFPNLRFIPIEVMTTEATWSVKNVQKEDNFIANGNFSKRFPAIYDSLEKMKLSKDEIDEIRLKLAERSRPGQNASERRIKKIKKK